MDKDPKYKKYKIGRWTYGSPKIEDWWHTQKKLEIGSFCSIARDVVIFLGGNHRIDWVTTSLLNDFFQYDCNKQSNRKYTQEESHGDVIIGNDVWIGTGVTILSGVKIGDGAVIGAEAVVAKNVEPYSIVVGNPIVCKKKRFDDETIKKLLSIKWWEWSDEKIKENIELLLSSNIKEFVDKFFINEKNIK